MQITITTVMKKLPILFFLLLQAICIPVQGGDGSQLGSENLLSGFDTRQQVMGLSRPLDVSVLVGPHFYLGEADYEAKFLDWWTFPAVDVAVTYWLTKCFAIGGSVEYRSYKGLGFWDSKKATFGYDASDPFYGNTSYVKTRGSYLNLYFNGSMDVTRYYHMDVRDEFRLVAYAGIGMAIATQAKIHRGVWSFQAGLRSQWTLDPHWCLEATICGHLISDDFDGEYAPVKEHNIPVDGALSLLFGITYRFHKNYGFKFFQIMK